MQFIGAPENLAFSVAIAVLLGIALLEGVVLLIGFHLSSWLDGLLPDLDLSLAPPDTLPALSPARLLGWLRLGELPALMALVVALTLFGLTGFLVQAMSWRFAGAFLPGWVAVPGALCAALPLTRGANGLLARLMPRNETEAVSEESLIGRVAVVVLGEARPGHAAQAKLRDAHGRSHYIMVEPDTVGEAFPAGTAVVVVARAGGRFVAIRNPHPTLVD